LLLSIEYNGSGSLLIPLANPRKSGGKAMHKMQRPRLRREGDFSYSTDEINTMLSSLNCWTKIGQKKGEVFFHQGTFSLLSLPPTNKALKVVGQRYQK